MISAFIYDEAEQEMRTLLKTLKDQAAYKTDDFWNFGTATRMADAEKYFEENGLVDMAYMDVCVQNGVSLLEQIRKTHQEMMLLVIADMTVSPMKYMRPGVMPTSLLLRPFSDQDASRIVGEFVDAYIAKREAFDPSTSFVVETKEGKIHIPYREIFFFESGEKKIFLQTRSEEYGFYGTIEALETSLPPYFLRCHRSFIVNARKIIRVLLSQNLIVLQEERDVPLSRSYKPALKNLGKSKM